MPAALEIHALSKHYGALPVLRDIELVVPQGEFFALLGPNGAGKTTLISILAGLVRADSGKACVMGLDVLRDYKAARRQLGVVPQELVFDPFFTVRETLRIQSGYFGLRRNDDWIEEILHHLDLEAKADANMRSLSGGMKRRVLVAQALVHRPPVIVLDEPTAGVDVELRQGLWKFVQRLNRDGHTIVLTTHYLEEAETLCSRIAMLKQGEIVALDTPERLIERFHALYLRVRFEGPVPGDLLRARCESSGDRHVFKLDSYAEVETALSALRRAGRQIVEMEVAQPDLEEVFVNIMHGERAGQA
jgi:ABC-2 type transport system ATP-binding protein